MAKYYLVVLLMRLLLPAGLLLSIAIRPFGISFVYLLLYLLTPLAQIPNTKTFSGWRGQILVLTLVISSILLLSHAVFHSTLAAFAPYGSILDEYPLVKRITCNLGYVSYAHIDPLVAVHYVAPELVMLGTSLIVYVAVKKLIAHAQPGESINLDSKHQKYPVLTSAGKYICLFLLMFSGVMRPSITSGIYFLVFIGATTAWSLGQPLKNGFAVIGRCLMGIMAVHILVLIVYQLNWLIDLYPPEQQFARYFGLTRLVTINETSELGFTYTVADDHEWATFVSPFVILFTYFILGIETRELFKPKAAYKYIDSKALRESPPRETTPLMRSISPSKRLTNMSMRLTHRHLHQDSTGSVVVPDDESIAEQEEPTLMDDIIAAIIDFFQILIRSSYIATTITMMAWSIMFHSWLAFVFLMWANVVWLCPNQRSFMLKTSPVLVCYAILLLLLQYIYGMDLTESELPSEDPQVNLRQIGVTRPEGSACVPLMIKSLFTCMFWVTLRQRVQDIRERRHSAVITEMAAPLQLTVSTAASAIESRGSGAARSRLMRALGERLRAACARYWIYVVVIMLFVIGITGERMTIFRILYMFLFLGFILMFQISWYWWRRLMYVFWITVIIYSMLNLILIYVYQFDELSKIIADYLYINVKLQHDLGLEQYTPADLFVKLLTPTLFLIITIMQVHYFHKDFMALSEPKTTTNSVAREAGSSRPSQGGASTIKDEVPALPLEEEQESGAAAADPRSDKEVTEVDQSIELSTLNTAPKKSIHRRDTGLSRQASGGSASSRRQLRAWAASRTRALRAILARATDQLFVSLDVHLIKIIFLAVMLLCVINVCAMHVPIMIIISIGLLMSQKKQRFIVLLISILISVYFMAKMVYQIDYISHSYFDINCTLGDGNETNEKSFNNAQWLGFLKMTHEKPLVTLLKGYIALIALFTFYSLVTYRQKAIRKNDSLPKTKNKLMFPHVTRKDADKDLTHCVKYLLNYGFYKFGVEICLICLVGVIGSRMDVYAVLYSVWLLVLVSSRRSRQSQLWPTFTVFIMVLVPIQYMISVGFVPQFCINYPWNGEDQKIKHIRTWLFLPYATAPPHASKLIFDYFLLLFASRQLIVFRIEKTQGDSYKGGSNREDIGTDWEKPTFVNPVPDFLSVGNWLDVVKRMVFLGMLWVTLAIMFLTGTNRVNLFSMGYLIGSFIFLWQGTDFYLRPKESILQWWSWLVRYNVCVVVVKALLQIPGCLFSTLVQEHACWLVQLLGIGCVDKFAGGNIAHFLKMDKYYKESKCTVPQEDIGLAWDGVCFAFLILQRRLFYSYYFYRVIDESKATTVLASRGAELIEELRQKQMRLQEEQEVKILEKIKIKMERIKANQKKIETVAKDMHHDAALGRSLYRPPATHQQAVRSGDYYMFDEFDDTEVHLKDEDSSDDEDGPKEMGFGKTRSRAEVSQHSDVNVTLTEREHDEVCSELEEYAPSPDEETKFETFKRYVETVNTFVSSFLISVTRFLMKYSRDYRYVSRTLTIEKRILKEKEGFGIGIREGSQMIWEPLPETIVHHKDVTTLEEQDDSMFKHKAPIVRLGLALWYAILAHTDIVCYVMVFVNQIQSATILSIPLPLMVFLWGTLTIPRPTKTFWVTLIAYTEVIVLIKSMFQFEILPWNIKVMPANMPFTAPRIIGIERKPNYAIYDLLLLLIIFLHRFMLKSLGLWKESTPEAELREDTEYELTAEDTQLIVEGRGDEVGRKYIKLHDHKGPSEEDDDVSKLHSTKSQFEERSEEEKISHESEQPGPSKPLEDDHFEVDDDQEPIIAVKTTLEENYKYYPKVVFLSLKRYLRPMKRFFKRMLAPGARVTADVYAYMFLCDFFNFLVVIFGFAAFGTQQGDGGVQAYLEENKVPIPFLVMLILQFVLIVVDRALYLRKFILGKILFQYALIIGVHVWMFFVLPFITERPFNKLLPPPMWYMVKCLYLLLSAYQIRCGYPRRIIGNFLCKSYRFINMVFFRGFMAVPFVFELRTLMDWIWTDTSMTLMDWLKMEDIFASVFLLKCSRYIESEFPQPRGQKKSNMSKYMLGGGVLVFVIAIIWFPLVFFAFGNSVGQPNPPTDVTVKIRIGPFLPIYQMSAQSHNIDVYTEQDYTQLSNLYTHDRTALTFLANYMYNDVAVISIIPNSTMTWDISPPELERLRREANSNASLSMKFTSIITHETNTAQNQPTIEYEREVQLEAAAAGGAGEGSRRAADRAALVQMLDGTAAPDTWLTVKMLFPKFVKVFNKGVIKPVNQLIPNTPADDGHVFRDVLVRLEREGDAMYWRVRELCEADQILNSIPRNNCDMLVMYTFNDKLFPETLNFISASGIIGLYTTFVFLASRVLRGFFSGIYNKIMFDDLPNVDRVLQLCLDIYLVREALELSLEEDLFAKLVFLYRSPETMIKWSRPKDETGEEQRALPPSR